MKQRLFAVRDGKVEQFFPPMCFQTPGAAQRWFEDLINNDKTELYKHPGDYVLYSIGEFDTDTGILVPTRVDLVVTGVDVFQAIDIPMRAVSHA